MFGSKKYAVQTKLVKTDEKNKNQEEKKFITPEAAEIISKHAKDLVRYTSLFVVGVYAVVKTIDTASQVTIEKTKNANKK